MDKSLKLIIAIIEFCELYDSTEDGYIATGFIFDIDDLIEKISFFFNVQDDKLKEYLNSINPIDIDNSEEIAQKIIKFVE